MIRINAVLATILVVCALALVTSQHKARKLFVELQKERDREAQLETEYGQLQLELSTWAMQARIEKIATSSLQMQVAPAARVYLVPPAPAPARP